MAPIKSRRGIYLIVLAVDRIDRSDHHILQPYAMFKS